mgnify:CR=1 FL=1
MKAFVFVVESLTHERLLKIRGCTTREIRAHLNSDDFIILYKRPVKV